MIMVHAANANEFGAQWRQPCLTCIFPLESGSNAFHICKVILSTGVALPCEPYTYHMYIVCRFECIRLFIWSYSVGFCEKTKRLHNFAQNKHRYTN